VEAFFTAPSGGDCTRYSQFFRKHFSGQAEGSGRKVGPGGEALVFSLWPNPRYGTGGENPCGLHQKAAEDVVILYRIPETSYMGYWKNYSHLI
jgi:hypothetical protein